MLEYVCVKLAFPSVKVNVFPSFVFLISIHFDILDSSFYSRIYLYFKTKFNLICLNLHIGFIL